MTTPVTPAMIRELRERTGVGMSKCKEALDQAQGDMELAIENLRKSGMATAVKKEGRETKEGLIGCAESREAMALIEVMAETDFVVKNERFGQFLANLAQEAATSKVSSLETFMAQPYSADKTLTVEQYRTTLVQTLGENIQIRRLKLVPKKPGHSYGVYLHLGGKIGVIVEVSGAGEEALAKEIAMHVAAAAPEYVSPEAVPEAIQAQEKEIARSQIQGKPAAIMDKIVEGKLKAFFAENCLVLQKYIRDDKMTVGELVAHRGKEVGKPLAIASFTRWNVGQQKE